jgi:hypothetical protein
VNILIWHVHGSWMTNFVQGGHTYVVPVEPDRGPDGRGRARTWDWPDNVIERAPQDLADTELDVVIVQSRHELDLANKWLDDRPGQQIPTVWLEHNAPQGAINDMCHPAKDRGDLTVVHVTATNALFWDTGETRAVVIEHGVIDPGQRWTGDVSRTAVVINEPLRRWRVTGSDLLAGFSAVADIDLFGMGAKEFAAALGRPRWLAAQGHLSQERLHGQLASRRCYLHPFRWTSLGLSLIEAMLMGMPVVALATTEVPDAVPQSCGVVSNDLRVLRAGIARIHADREWAERLGRAARLHALDRFSLDRFLADWDQLLETIQ